MGDATKKDTPTLAIETIARDLAARAGLTPPDLSLWHLAAACVALDILPRYAVERMAEDLVAGKTTIASADRWLRGHLVAGLARMQAELRSLRANAAAVASAGKPSQQPSCDCGPGSGTVNIVIAGAAGQPAAAQQIVPMGVVRQIARNSAIEMTQMHLRASLDVGGRRWIPETKAAEGQGGVSGGNPT